MKRMKIGRLAIAAGVVVGLSSTAFANSWDKWTVWHLKQALGSIGDALSGIHEKLDGFAEQKDQIQTAIDEVAGGVDEANDKLDALGGGDPSGLELRFVKLQNELLDGGSALFQIRIFCERAFEMKGLYVTARDPGNVEVEYFEAVALSDIFGGLGALTRWDVAHGNASALATPMSAGLELLSSMGVQPIGIADGGSFDILGTRDPNTAETQLNVGAVVLTERGPNACNVVIVDN